MRYWVGVDWGQREHAVCVVDESGAKCWEGTVAHSQEALAELLERLAEFSKGSPVPVAVERPDGLLIDSLRAAGHPVIPIPPQALRAFRPRYQRTGAKSDPADAFLLAEILRTDGHRFQALREDSDELRALRAASRMRCDLVTQRTALTNQLRSFLDTFWPGVIDLFHRLDCPIALRFLAAFPSPDRAPDERSLARFLKAQGYPGRKTPAQLRAHWESAPRIPFGPRERAVREGIVRSLVAVLLPLVEEIGKLSRQIEASIPDLATGRLLMSLPRAGRVNAAQIAVEVGDDPGRYASVDHLAAVAGVVPVTSASGKSHSVRFRLACNHRLRRAWTCFADHSRRDSPWAQNLYQNARRRGCSHSHAVRILSRAWMKVFWACWTAKTPYDPRAHNAAQPFLDDPQRQAA